MARSGPYEMVTTHLKLTKSISWSREAVWSIDLRLSDKNLSRVDSDDSLPRMKMATFSDGPNTNGWI